MDIRVIELLPPELEFGAVGNFTDPRIGLKSAGPFSLRFGGSHISQVRLSLVGSREMLNIARHWFKRTRSEIKTAKIGQPMYVDFPGFESAFQSALAIDESWDLDIGSAIQRALERPQHERFEAVLGCFSRAIRKAHENNRIDVIVCCLTSDILAKCGTVSRTLSREEKKRVEERKRRIDSAQLSLSELWEVEDTPEDLLKRDFRRALKAEAMITGVPIQIATLGLFDDNKANQDAATRAWNSSVALFYKAGGIPWRVRTQGPETCYIGISFHQLSTTHRRLMYASLAQAFSSEGEGFALRGEAVPRSADESRTPHMSEEQATRLGSRVLEEYRQRTGTHPSRVVLHKTTQFDTAERRGFHRALNLVPLVEFVNISPSDFRLVQRTPYPPKRGTLCTINRSSHYLFTTGFVPEWQTYPGVHIPAPAHIITDPGSDIRTIAREVLGLARMNWNTAFDTTGAPITLRFARQVGGIMAEVGKRREPHPSYRFYM